VRKDNRTSVCIYQLVSQHFCLLRKYFCGAESTRLVIIGNLTSGRGDSYSKSVPFFAICPERSRSRLQQITAPF